MEWFINFLAHKKAGYYFDLYVPGSMDGKDGTKRIKPVDEYVLLLDIIEHLPVKEKAEVDRLFKDKLEALGVQRDNIRG